MADVVTVERAVEALRAGGRRVTPQRTLILECLLDADDHISAETLYENVRTRHPDISPSTVYRTLELLRDAGLITQTDLGAGSWQFHPVHKADHHHLICQGCGAVTEASPEIFEGAQAHLLETYGFDALITHHAIYGRCKECR